MSDPTSRKALLLQAVEHLPEGERDDIISLLDAGEWGEAAHQMRGGPGDRQLPREALDLIDRAVAEASSRTVSIEDLCPADQAAVRAGRLYRHARKLAEAGDPGAVEAEAAYVSARLAGEEAGLLLRRIELADLRDRHAGILPPDAEVYVGVGWQALVEDALRRLAGLHVRVTTIREKFGGLDLKVWPDGHWREGEIELVEPARGPSRDAALRTCEACGAPGIVREVGRWRTRCDAHADVE